MAAVEQRRGQSTDTRVFTRLAKGVVIAMIVPLVLSLTPVRALAQQPPAAGLELESRSVVFSYPQIDPYDRTNLYGFNHAPSVAVLPDGRLLCVWFSGPYEGSVDQVILASFSSDEGRTWGKAFVLQDEPRNSDFDPALIRDGKRMWLFYVTGRWNRYPFAQGVPKDSSYIGDNPAGHLSEKAYIGPGSFHLYMRYSDDSGETWTPPKRVHDTAGSRSNGIRLTTGELLLPAHDFMNNWTESYVVRSTDGGETWERSGSIVNKSGVDEPTIAELKNGDVLMALRTNDGFLWTCVSKDKGKTWSKPRRQEMQAGAASHNLFRMSDGRIALTHNECEVGKRTPLTMRITEDGETWGEPLTIAQSLTPGQGNDYWGCQVTYPSVCEVSGNTLVVVWAYINMSNTVQYGDIRAARIRFDD
jgi:predicted neuraminidase